MTETIQVSPSVRAPLRGRIEAFDSVRGMYMVLIAGLHLLNNLRSSILAQPGAVVLHLIGGTVAFVSMSGFMAGYAFRRRPEREQTIVSRYRRQAFKLVIAHPFILFALYDIKRLTIAQHGLAWRSWFVTDTFAVMFLLIVPVLPRLSARARLLSGVACILASRVLYALHLGQAAGTLLLIDILAGTHPNGPHVLYENYALLTLSGMFLIGSQIGQVYAQAQAEGREQTMPGQYRRAAAVLVALGVGLIGLWFVLRRSHPAARVMLYPDYHLPLYPIHLAIMLALVAYLLQTERLPGTRQYLSVLGRKSFVVYIAQYYVVQWLPFVLKLYGRMTLLECVPYLAVSTVILHRIAVAFDRPVRWGSLAQAVASPDPPEGRPL